MTEFDPSVWAAAASRLHMGSAHRLVCNALLDRATDEGIVRARPARIAAQACLSVTVVSDALAELAAAGLVGRGPRGALVLLSEGWSP